jgi:hypothetical protein
VCSFSTSRPTACNPISAGIGAFPGHHNSAGRAPSFRSTRADGGRPCGYRSPDLCPATWTINVQPGRSGSDGASDSRGPQDRPFLVPCSTTRNAPCCAERLTSRAASSAARFRMSSATLRVLRLWSWSGMPAVSIGGHVRSIAVGTRAQPPQWRVPHLQILHITTAAVLHGEHTVYILVEGVEKPTDKRSASLLYSGVVDPDSPERRRTSPHPLRAPGPAATSTEGPVPVLRATDFRNKTPIPRQGAPQRGPRPRADVLPRGTARGKDYALAVRHRVDRKVTLN